MRSFYMALFAMLAVAAGHISASRGALRQPAAASTLAALTPEGERRQAKIEGTYGEKYQEFEGNWTTEHRNDAYPTESEGKWHHPDFGQKAAPKAVKSAAVQGAVVPALVISAAVVLHLP